MPKEVQMCITWHCPDCAKKLGDKSYIDGDYYSCLCFDGYWEMVKGKWEWRKGSRPRNK